MSSKLNLQEIEEAVKENHISLALARLREILHPPGEINLLEFRYNALKDQKHSGTIKDDIYQVEVIKLVSTILAIINEEKLKTKEQDKSYIQISKDRNALKSMVQELFINEYEIIDEIPGSQNHRSIIYRARSKKQMDLFHAIKVFKVFSLIAEENHHEVHYALKDLKKTSRHEGIIDVININTNTFPWYIIMEYIEGGSLDDYIKGDWKWSTEEAVDMLSSIVESVWNCHQEGIVHGNIRPKNILLNKNENNKPVISPFRILPSSFFNRRTQDTIIKSCKYLSPEELYGEETNELSDQFSVGLIGIELLTGKPLYGGSSVLEIINERHQHVHNSNFVSEKMKNLPEELVSILSRMLAPLRSDRYRNLYEIQEDLQKVICINADIADEKLKAIKLSYDRCRRQDSFIHEFYTDFFLECPAMQTKFTNLESQYKMLDIAIDRLINVNGFIANQILIKRMKKLGHFHQEMNIKKEDFEIFNTVLLNKIQKFDEKKWSKELQSAWKEFLDQAISIMKPQ